MNQRVTMKEVARQAGVTQATVSLCLADNPRIPLATRQRIKSLAEKLGYRPNPYVSALMRIRRLGQEDRYKPVIALINAMEHQDGWKNSASPTVRLMREGLIERARERGYRTEEFWLHQEGMSTTRFSGMLQARGIKGVVLGPLAVDAPAPFMQWEHFATVRLGVPLAEVNLTSVCNDHFFSSLQAVRACWQLGYRRPGLVILATHRVRFSGRWNGGLLVAEDLLPGTMPVPPLLLASWSDLSPLDGWLRREKPDVVITSSPAVDLLPALRSQGWKIPQDLGLATLACPKLGDAGSGIYQNGRLIGATALDTVISMLERNESGLPVQAQTVMIQGVWNPGRTLRRLA